MSLRDGMTFLWGGEKREKGEEKGRRRKKRGEGGVHDAMGRMDEVDREKLNRSPDNLRIGKWPIGIDASGGDGGIWQLKGQREWIRRPFEDASIGCVYKRSYGIELP